ncbi:GNAT family N-acetyltransferase [Wolbachia endosymbiont (group A) of Sicus ferrugineus]|uniref:GNAT family N-acetyltransferase n=1 Tax=Wolbachia endosymbiont (group A) of Sicus ferrugineus TaxID=2954056 RepID=UPI002230CDA6|nr:GNAT family N-acetyltransferase [Wolbachia endosymbiont (group A) of Sicus ferrugineus]
MKIEYTTSPNNRDIEFLSKKINEETADKGTCDPFAFFIRDDTEQIIAGCSGSVMYGSIYTDLLWVHSDYRGKGFGRQLMEKVHDYGREMHCKIATITTMNSKIFKEPTSIFKVNVHVIPQIISVFLFYLSIYHYLVY